MILLIVIIYLVINRRSIDFRRIIRRNVIFTILMAVIITIYVFIITTFSRLVESLTAAQPEIIDQVSGSFFIAATFGSLSQFLNNLTQTQTTIITGAIMFLLVVIGFEPLKKFLQRITDRFLFKGEYSSQELLSQLAEISSSTLDLEVLLKEVIDKMSQAFRSERVAIMLSKNKQGDFFVVAEKDYDLPLGHNIKKNDPLAEYYRTKREIAILNELHRQINKKKKGDNWLKLVERTVGTMEHLEASLIVPIYSKGDLIGFFLLGNKKSGDIYNSNDLKVLGIIAGQMSTAIESAQLYGELKDFNMALKKEVAEATADLRAANKRLKELDKIKSEFISIASHKLRTPLTAIKGYISMILDGSFGKLAKTQKEPLEKVFISNERLIRLVDNLLDVYRIDSGKIQFNFQPVKIVDLVNNIVNEAEENIEKQGLKLEFIKPREELPVVQADEEKIKEVIWNIVDNATKYTKKGGLKIKLEQLDNDIIFSCTDTGVGINLNDLNKLFQKFSRGQNMSLIDTEGTGLGLYVSRRLIEAHKGRIWAESEGENKGSRFSFALPTDK